ncbi:MAG: tetratricopeptide repeat protein [Anaerolineae bacterium]|nr:tetratricopeptide repeat protein [Anaerolineae bacterium]
MNENTLAKHRDAGRAGRRHAVVRHGTRFALLFLALCLGACMPKVVKENDAGNIHYEKQEYDEALTAYRQAQVAEPDLAEPYYNAANAYNRQGQVDGALAQTEQTLKTADGQLAAQAWYNLGNAHFDAQQWDQAIESYKASLRLNPGDADAKHNLELALQAQQQQAQQQQQQQQQSSQDQQNQEDQNQEKQQTEEQENQSDSQTAQATPTPEGQSENQESQSTEGQEPEGTPTPQAGAQAQEGEMTPDQAQQLLMALLGDSETLQEKLQEIHRVPGADPKEDW